LFHFLLSYTRLFLHISHIFFFFVLLVPFSSHLTSSFSGSLLLDPLFLFASPLFPSLPHFTPGGGGGSYSTILLGSMLIIHLSTVNIIIHRGIYSNNFLLGPDTNFHSVLLEDWSLHSIENSIIYPYFTHSNHNSIYLAHLLSTNINLLTMLWSQNSDSWDPHVDLISILLLIHSYNK
jgi:hypothetical protein